MKVFGADISISFTHFFHRISNDKLRFSLYFSRYLIGANLSAAAERDGGGPPSRPRLGDIPESCAALILAQLNPPEICKLARLNRSFRSASSADFIWESKLPSGYKFIVEKVLVADTSLRNLQKKELYARLCRPNPFDGGTKEIRLDKNTGGVCLSISSKALTITGIDDRRYWSHISTEESRYSTVAYLQQTWWFEVDGELEFQFPAGTYSLFFRLQLGKSLKRLGRQCLYMILTVIQVLTALSDAYVTRGLIFLFM
ncbi:F-box protein PP2-A13 [Hibiscus syriacus]|uniref:F-box protein PP2-A13 n=1 Tax=Hibiscus syriacus TaxID=106335 RepID=A0A6A2YN17_HIBSY|nr:F-box protein PP2-A13 [Hibiscus syriacus]